MKSLLQKFVCVVKSLAKLHVVSKIRMRSVRISVSHFDSHCSVFFVSLNILITVACKEFIVNVIRVDIRLYSA